MFEQRTPVPILLGGAALAALAGMVNAAGFLGAYHQAFSHLSGTVTFLAADVVRADWPHALQAGGLLLAFFLGATLSGIVIRDSHLKFGRRYGAALLIESGLLSGAAALMTRGSIAGGLLAASACGLQNAMATTYSGAIVRTTHMTGIITDLGLIFSHWLRRRPGRGGRARLLLCLLGGFLLGGGGGTALFLAHGPPALFVPAAVAAIAGMAQLIWRARHRRSQA